MVFKTLTPQAQSSECNMVKDWENVPWRDNCVWGVKLLRFVILKTNLSMLMLSNQKLLAQCFSRQALQHFYKVLLVVDFRSCKALHLHLSHQEYFYWISTRKLDCDVQKHTKVRHVQILKYMPNSHNLWVTLFASPQFLKKYDKAIALLTSGRFECTIPTTDEGTEYIWQERILALQDRDSRTRSGIFTNELAIRRSLLKVDSL